MEFLKDLFGKAKPFSLQAWEFLKANPLEALFWLVGIYFGIKIFIFLFRYFFHFLSVNRKSIVYMRVTLPREEAPKDKEVKELEKDFREKIAVMEQLFRSIHEIRELHFWNMVKVFFFGRDIVSWELVVQEKLVDFYVTTFKEYQSIIEKQITSYYPDADIQFVEPYEIHKSGYRTLAYYAYLKRPFWFPIKTYKTIENDPLNNLTNVLSKLTEDERAVIQLVSRPKGFGWQKKAEEIGTTIMKGKKPINPIAKIPIIGRFYTLFTALIFGYERALQTMETHPGASHGDPFVRMLQTKEEMAKQIGEKARQVGYDCVIRIFTTAKSKIRARDILNDMVVALNLFKAADMNWFQTRRIIPIDFINTRIMLHNFRLRLVSFMEKQSTMVPEELASFFHLPSSRFNATPIIRWLTYKVLPAPTDMGIDGILLGYNMHRGAKKEIHFLKQDRSRHHYIIGKSGTGKSAFLGYIARQDIQNGEGVCVIDPHGDLVDDIIPFIPKERAKDVVIFDPSDTDRPMGLNILEAETPEQMELAASQGTEIFIKLFGDEIFGPRIQHYFRNACLTLMEDKEEGATLIDVPRIFVDFDFQKYKVARIKNPVVRSFWEHEYAQTGAREKEEMIPYFSAKFGPFITNYIMRNTIGQVKSGFNFRKVMDEGKILLIKLSKGAIGDLNTQLLGLVIVARIQMAAMSRTDTPEPKRRDFFLYVDEFQNFATDSFASILSEARKYHLNLIMAHQYINQLVTTKFGVTSSQIRDAVFGNVGTLQSFKVGAEDAEFLAKEYAPLLSEQDVIGISNYKCYIKLNIKNTTSRVFSMETIWDLAGKNEKLAPLVREYSRMKYGRKKEFVDQEIEARIGIET